MAAGIAQPRDIRRARCKSMGVRDERSRMAECPVSSYTQATTTTSYTLPPTMGVLTSYYTSVVIVIGLYILYTGQCITCYHTARS